MRDTALLAVKLVSLFADAIGTVFLTLNSSDFLVLPILPILGVFWHLVLIKVKGIRLVLKTQGMLDFRVSITEAQLNQLVEDVELRLIQSLKNVLLLCITLLLFGQLLRR